MGAEENKHTYGLAEYTVHLCRLSSLSTISVWAIEILYNRTREDESSGDWDLGVVLQTRAARGPSSEAAVLQLAKQLLRWRKNSHGVLPGPALMRLGTEIGTSADPLIDRTICEAAWVVARQNYSNDLDSNAIVDSTRSRSLGPFGLSVMLKACGLVPGVSCLQIHSIRALWAPRVVRSFSTTLTVCGHQRPKSSRTHGSRDTNRRLNLPTIETNELQSHKSQERIPPSTQSSEREDEIVGDTSLPVARGDENNAAPDNAYGDSKVPQGQTAWESEPANDGQGTLEQVPWRDRMGHFQREITVPQDFHAKLHASLLKSIMQSKPVLRGMPVYDATFDAVRSGRNLFIQTALPVRSLQYLLPVIQGIHDCGVLRRRREVKPDAQLPPRPSSLLVVCPTLGGAQDVQMMGTKLQRRDVVVDMMALSVPAAKQINPLRTLGFNILMSTPEFILQWLALPHAKIPLIDALQDVQTLVVDGQASSLRRGDFLEVLKEVMSDLPLNKKTQRVIVSDKHDPQLDERLAGLVLDGGYEVLQEPRLEEIMDMQRAQEKKRQEMEKSQRTNRRPRNQKRGVGRAKERF
ncbi:hypothetical protein FJTKL_10054 [Diaporthe vaccinii]|uniref:Uncharacterized protein n=1 Tax=Diaporthe vaccinii TaxID=105482 RepID=A0ABR4EL54_9PEZI